MRSDRVQAPAKPQFTELIAPAEGARVFEQRMRPGLADCAPSGRIRLDALSRWLQDVAYADVEDAGLAQSAVWVVRRSRISVRRFPQFAEPFTVRTFCSGLGRMWAERRTTIMPAAGRSAPAAAPESSEPESSEPAVEAVSLWVHLDPADWRPMPFSREEIEAYGVAGTDRRVTARLRHPQPSAGLEHRRWQFRATECDIANHVNNSAYWQPLEEELLARGEEPLRLDAEIEFRTPSQPGEKLLLADDDRRWIVSPGGETHASILFSADWA